MDIRQLKYFVKVVETGSVTRAAELLYVAQPALGLQIRKLEEELGVQLLIRHSRGVEPTESGALLFAEAKEILTRVQAAAGRVRDLDGAPRGKVIVGTTPAISALLSGKLVRRCAAALPEVSLSLVEALTQVLLEWIESNRVNIAFVHRSLSSPALSLDPLASEDLLFISAPGYCPLLAEKTPLREVADYPLILPAVGHALRDLLEQKSAERDITLEVPFEVHSPGTMCELVAQGVGCTVLPLALVKKYVSERRLIATPIDEPRLTRTLYLVTSAKKPLTRAEAAVRNEIIELVREEVAQSAGAWRPPPEIAT